MGEIDYRAIVDAARQEAVSPPPPPPGQETPGVDYGELVRAAARDAANAQASGMQERLDAALAPAQRPPGPAPDQRWYEEWEAQGTPEDLAELGTPAEQAEARRLLESPLPMGIDPRSVAAIGIGMLLPHLGAQGGAALMARIGTPKLGALLGELAGNLAARKANVAIGAEQPGIEGDVASVAIPATLRGISAARQGIGRHIAPATTQHMEAAERLAALAPEPSGTATPAAQRALEALEPSGVPSQTAQEWLEQQRPAPGFRMERLQDALRALEPTTPAKELYPAVYADVTPIRSSNLMMTARDVIKKEQIPGTALQESKVIDMAESLLGVVRKNHGAVPLNELLDNQQRLRLRIEEAANHRWTEEAGYRKLYSAIYDDVEYAVKQGVPGAKQMLHAAQAHNREMALHDIQRMVTPGSPGIDVAPDGTVRLPSGAQLEHAIDRKFASDRLFAQAFTTPERDQIRQVLRELRSADAVEGFLERLQAGKPGMVLDPTTGQPRLGNVTPLRGALEQELAQNPDLAAALPGQTVGTLRTVLQEAEREQSVQRFLERLQPGKPGVTLDPNTGGARLENIRPIRTAFEREAAQNPAFAAALGPARLQAVRTALERAGREHTQTTLSHMLRPGGPGVVMRDDGFIEVHGGRIRKAFELALRDDPQFAAGVSPHTRAAIRRTLADIEALPKIRSSGQRGVVQVIATGAAAGVAQQMGAGPVGTAVATSLALALMSPRGRAWLARQIAKEGHLSPALLGLENVELRMLGESILTEEPTTGSRQERIP